MGKLDDHAAAERTAAMLPAKDIGVVQALQGGSVTGGVRRYLHGICTTGSRRGALSVENGI